MFRKPGSTMTAVEIVSCMYDGPIPVDVMMQARAEDAAYEANPQREQLKAAQESVAWNTQQARQSIARIRQFMAAGHLLSAETESEQVLPCHLKARRQYQAEVRHIMQGAG